MTPTKQTVFLPVRINSETVIYCEDIGNVEKQEGYFFTSEQLNQFISNIIKDTLDTAAKAVKDEIACDLESTVHYSLAVKPSITNTFDITYKKYL
jgi:hypothetical protein